MANPTGPQVVNGQVGFASQGNMLTVTNTPGSIINWQGFSIEQNEITRFLQQNPNSAVLNRIVGQDPSRILGALQSNGRVFLVNPNGIVFGQGAQVDVNGLVASTLSIGNDDFIKGKWNFQAGDKAGSLKNEGAITTPSGGQVYLIAPNVENSGIITSPKGEVMLAAGRSVQLVDSTNPDLHVVVSAPEDSALNLGQIVAQSGRADIYGALINQRGVVNANSAVVGENGKIVFKASRDTILDAGSVTTAAGAGKGGEIHILGERVGLTGDAKVDVSARQGGGTVLIGGDYHGGNPLVQNAKRTYVGKDARIKADATANGDGGKVIVWSDEVTRNYGDISARGGPQGGDGGFVESSGKQTLEHHATVDVGAPNGKGGTLLLDPAAITIVGGTGDGASSPDGSTTFQGSATAGTVNFSDSDLTSAGVSNIYQSELEGLGAGTNIVLEATDYISATGTFSNLVTLPSNSNLTMRTRNASTDGTATIGINLVGSTDSSNLEFKTQGTGTITLQTGTGTSPQSATINVGKLTTAGGTITLNASGNVVLRGATTTPGGGNGGDISLTSGGYMTLGGANIDARGSGGSSGNVTLASGGAISMQTLKTIYGNQLKMTAASGIYGTSSSDSMTTQVSTLNASNSGAGDIRISNSAANLSIGDIGASGYGIKQISSGQGIYVTNATGNSITVNKQIVTNNAPVSLTGAAGLALTASNPITTGTGAITLATSDSEAMLSMPAGSQVSSSGGAFVTLKSDKMSLLGAINAGTTGGVVKLAPVNAIPINLATVATDSTANTLELSAAELNTITAGTLVIGETTSGAIDIKAALNSGSGGALQNITTALKLNSAGAITQQAGAGINGGSSVSANGSSVTLTEANGTGVISGAATTGDFQYHSTNQVTVSNVDSVNGITVPAASKIYLESDASAVGINQITGSPLTGGKLAVKTKGQVNLFETTNNITNVVGDLNPGSLGTGSFFLYDNNNLTVGGGPFFSISGLTTNNQSISVKTAAGKTLTVSDAINAGSTAGLAKVGLETDTLSITTGSVTASDVGIRPASTNYKITVGSATCVASPCLTVKDLYKISAGTIGIGTPDSSKLVGDIAVVGITDTNTSAVTDIANGVTTRIGLLTGGGGVTQTGAITVNDLGVVAGSAVNLTAANKVTNFAGQGTGTGNAFSFINNQTFNVGTLSGGISPNNYSLSGVTTANGNISLCGTAGDIVLAASVAAGTGTVSLSSSAGAISQSSGNVSGSSLSASSANGIGHGGVLNTVVSSLTGASASAAGKDINIVNSGALTVSGTVSTNTGNISLKAKSPLTVSSAGLVTSTAGGNITLEAGSTNSSGDTLTINGKIAAASGANVVVATTGAINLKAGASITVTDTVSGNVTQQPNLNSVNFPPATPVAPPPPSINQCTTDPTIAGCAAVLPSLSTCTTTPTAAGCSAVLPSLSTCTTTPTAAGCSAVLPSLSTCTTDPTTAGCTAVLPSLSTCTTTPTAAGCSAVLPSISTCTTTPTAAGCSAVLPTVSTCTTAPTTAGCTAVLPSLSTCTTTPTAAGCSAVLPSISTCTTTPTAAGCTAVLPSLSACTTTPTAAGCTAVLPSLSTCTTTPTAAGCTAVLPSVATCTTTPTAAGCTAVLPSLSSCTTNPTQAGCNAVLPSLSQCSADLTLVGCSAVLPSISECSKNSSTAGCSVVLPTASKCAVNPSLSGCEVVLPPTKTTESPSKSGNSSSGNTTTETIVNTTTTTTNVIVVATTTTETTLPASSQGSSGGSTTKIAPVSESKSSASKSDDSKQDDSKKGDKKETTAGPQDEGAKKNDTAKKMYCN